MAINEIKTTQDIVMIVLMNHPMARNSDNYLCHQVYQEFGRMKGIDLNNMSVLSFFLKMKDLNLPSIETIGRIRRKIQAEYPELEGDKSVKSYRQQKEEDFREYARS